MTPVGEILACVLNGKIVKVEFAPIYERIIGVIKAAQLTAGKERFLPLVIECTHLRGTPPSFPSW